MAVALIFLLALGGGFLFPWWWPVPLCYVLGFWLGGPNRLSRRPFTDGSQAFAAGLVGTGAAWLLPAALSDWRNHQVLSSKVATLFHLPYPWMLLALTALAGGLLGGLAAWAGQALRIWLSRRRHAEGLDPA